MSYKIREIRPFSGWRVDVYTDEDVFSVFIDGEAVKWGRCLAQGCEWWSCCESVVPVEFGGRVHYIALSVEQRLELFEAILSSGVWKAWAVLSGHRVINQIHRMMKSFIETHKEAIWRRKLGETRLGLRRT